MKKMNKEEKLMDKKISASGEATKTNEEIIYHWTFKLGFPESLLCCKDCAYWQFF